MVGEESEAMVIALRNTFMPRLGERDASVFATMIRDLWPDSDVPMVFGGKYPCIPLGQQFFSVHILRPPTVDL